MEPLAFLLRRYNVDFRADADIHLPSYVAVGPRGVVLATRRGIRRAERNARVAVELARVILGQLDRAPLDEVTRVREWRRALRWAADVLLSDDVMASALREHLEPWQIAEATDVPEELVRLRLHGFLPGARQALPIMDWTRLEGAFGR